MTQYATFRIKFPDNTNAKELKDYLEQNGYEVYIERVFLQMKGFPIPDEFIIKDMKGGNNQNGIIRKQRCVKEKI